MIVSLTRGMQAVIDDDDAHLVAGYKWQAAVSEPGRFYAAASPYIRGSGRGVGQAKIYMHRVIMSAEPNQSVDHIDGDGLNNRRSNLRFCTNTQNMQNMRGWKTARSKYKGVWWNTRPGRWQADITVNGRKVYIGKYDDEMTAARAYDAAALRYFGEFARVNLPAPQE